MVKVVTPAEAGVQKFFLGARKNGFRFFLTLLPNDGVENLKNEKIQTCHFEGAKRLSA